jgi:hypothetical protein
MDNTNIFCFLPWGTAVEWKVNCNSVFMLENIPTVGAEIRRIMHWIPPEQEIYLVMDNAGGHGIEEAVDEYTSTWLRALDELALAHWETTL